LDKFSFQTVKRGLKIGVLVLLGLILLGTILLYPYKVSGIPEWRIHVLDADGKPMVNVPVSQEWLDPVDEGNASGDQQQTDATGTVVFPRRILHTRLELGFRGVMRSSRVLVCSKEQYGTVGWEGSGALPGSLSLRRGPCPYD
jgi:hypothetical protein